MFTFVLEQNVFHAKVSGYDIHFEQTSKTPYRTFPSARASQKLLSQSEHTAKGRGKVKQLKRNKQSL